jgi:hypothetical protein
MKRPLLNKVQRLDIRHNTYYAAKLKHTLAWLHFKRELERAFKQLFKL